MKSCRKPDLSAPRYRAKRKNILNSKFYDAFREEAFDAIKNQR